MAATWYHRHWGALAVGLAVTLAAVAVDALRLTQRFEWIALDWQFRHVNHIDADDRIVHIDIDDGALQRVGSWPWPRDKQAGLVRVLRELGAKMIVLDLVYPESRPNEIRLPSMTAHAAIEGQVAQIGEASAENMVLPDSELAAAIRDAGNVYLGVFYKPLGLSPLEQKVVAVLARALDAEPTTIAEAIGRDVATVEALPLVRLRSMAVEQRITECLTTRPAASVREVHEAITPAEFDSTTLLGQEIRDAYQRVTSLRRLLERSPPVPDGLRGRIPRAESITPSLEQFLTGARAAGFVEFKPDDDGALRRLPLLIDYQGRLIKQLAFVATCEELGIRDEDLRIDDDGSLRTAARGDRSAERIQLDRNGRMLINWQHGGPYGGGHFRHVPAAKVMEVHDARTYQAENETRRAIRIGEVARRVKGEAFEGYRQQVQHYLADRRRLHAAELDGRAGDAETQALRTRVEQQRRAIDVDNAETIRFVRETWESMRDVTAADAQEAAELARFREAYTIITDELPRIDAANATLQARIDAAIAQLTPVVAGRICFVGHTATAVADMVDAPVQPRLPGVLVHSNLLNTFLRGRFLRWADGPTRAATLVLVGIIATLISASRGPRLALTLILLLMATIAAVCMVWLFGAQRYWLPVVGPATLPFVVWAMVVMFRYLVTERETRRFSRALAQYTSPAIARRIAEDAERLDLSPVSRDVTCYFSDLADFTTLSEQYLDPARTRAVLNPYLEAMSRVLHGHAALINKFIGDGVFAFFNPPIYPCADHATRACDAAIEAQQALAALIVEQRDSPLAHVFERLRMRIGLATGPVFVGDYGSENKLDYTCMGDTVNLASRLEGAGKAFGTRILVAGPTKDAAGKGLVWRPLGALQVRGKQVAVPVYELLGREGTVSDVDVRYAGRFGEAVTAFAARRFDEVRAILDELQSVRPDDRAATRYRMAIDTYAHAPPPADWNGAIELTEK